MQTTAITSKKSLFQGDIFNIKNMRLKQRPGDGRSKHISLSKCYPTIKIKDVKFGILITQSCDLDHRDEDFLYLTVGFLEPLEKYVQKLIKADELTKNKFTFKINGNDFDIYNKTKLVKKIQDNLDRLFKNNLPWAFFISISEGLFIINLTKTVPIRWEHQALVKRRLKYRLKDQFRSKLSWKYASLFGRAGADDYSKQELKKLSNDVLRMVEQNNLISKGIILNEKPYQRLKQVENPNAKDRNTVFTNVMKTLKKKKL